MIHNELCCRRRNKLINGIYSEKKYYKHIYIIRNLYKKIEVYFQDHVISLTFHFKSQIYFQYILSTFHFKYRVYFLYIYLLYNIFPICVDFCFFYQQILYISFANPKSIKPFNPNLMLGIVRAIGIVLFLFL